MSENGLFSKLKKSLSQTGGGLFATLFGNPDEKLNDEFYDELLEAMVIADMGYELSERLIGELKAKVKELGIKERSGAREQLIELLSALMTDAGDTETYPMVILVVGVNGVGKTTTIGKLANYYAKLGKSTLLAAADTFRAAASEQLSVWAQRADVPIIKHGEGADPAAVVFDAAASFKAKKRDILICDTAGRLHNKKNLMSELEKIRRVITRELPDARIESLLILDATTGQNAIAQAKIFDETAMLTGVVITKLDGTAKGGFAVAVKEELGIPVKYIGIGEGIDDIAPFDAKAYASALL